MDSAFKATEVLAPCWAGAKAATEATRERRKKVFIVAGLCNQSVNNRKGLACATAAGLIRRFCLTLTEVIDFWYLILDKKQGKKR